jgi:myosin-crossreactive antigen
VDQKDMKNMDQKDMDKMDHGSMKKDEKITMIRTFFKNLSKKVFLITYSAYLAYQRWNILFIMNRFSYISLVRITEKKTLAKKLC